MKSKVYKRINRENSSKSQMSHTGSGIQVAYVSQWYEHNAALTSSGRSLRE